MKEILTIRKNNKEISVFDMENETYKLCALSEKSIDEFFFDDYKSVKETIIKIINDIL